MFVLIGIAILFGTLIFGYTHAGGKMSALMQWAEFIIIGGAALGSVVIAHSFKGVIGMLKAVVGLLKGNPYKKDTYLDLLRAMYDIFCVARKDGLLSLEKHVENPHESEVFKRYPSLIDKDHALDFCTDTLKVIIMGGVNVHDLSDLMDLDLEAQAEEAMKMPYIFTTVGDAMPAFGIVAAVLGVVITMQAIGGPPEKVGEKVGAALVGTFLGVLLAYGLYGPIGRALELIAKSEGQYLACIKQALVAFARGDAPVMCAEFARRSIEPEVRPTFAELEEACRTRKDAAPEELPKAA